MLRHHVLERTLRDTRMHTAKGTIVKEAWLTHALADTHDVQPTSTTEASHTAFKDFA